MKLQQVLATLLFSLISTLAFSQAPPPSADDVMKDAVSIASKENKNIMIIFHASWCGWCKKMDKSMEDASVKKYFDDNFVVRHLTVEESEDKKNLENPGGKEFRDKYYGDKAGLPFWIVFDKNGKRIADSQIRPEGASMDSYGDNVGCPASEKEVKHFITILKKTTKLSKEQEDAIITRFRKNDTQ